MSSVGDLGSGAGKGGGAGGAVREGGGALGRSGAAKEEQYFHEQNEKQLKELGKKVEQQTAKDVLKQLGDYDAVSKQE
ncbi:unnamed protein product [Enterobius vermicularis]|uniref:ATPase inhibitor, mitochondrial n=1 Tax=Enterobius vermicularis TaxID=51028 RepID=A0A0N4V5P1_ENTVE|nr:unnamed protein product [Enterobius vermicularis]